MESLKRYEKHGVLGRELASLPIPTRQSAHKQINFLEKNSLVLFEKLLSQALAVPKGRPAAKLC
jgi:hypothetical protein